MKLTETEERILENQELILISLYRLLMELNSTGKVSEYINADIDAYHLTRKILGKEYIDRGRTSIDYL